MDNQEPISYKKRKYQERKESNLCVRCGKISEIGVYCKKHYDLSLVHRANQKRRKELKLPPRIKKRKDKFQTYIITNNIKDLSYLAGLIDGEGCIFIARNLRKGRKNYAYSMQIKIAMTNEKAVSYIHKTFGGSFYYKKPTKKEHLKQSVWLVCGQEALAILKAIKDYLIGKVEQCKLGITFQEYLNSSPREGYKKTQLSNEAMLFCEESFIKMKQLKENGGC